MTGSGLGGGLLAGIFDRPSTSSIVLVAFLAMLGWGWHVRCTLVSRPRGWPLPDTDRRPADLGVPEPPAVVALLTNGFDTPDVAVSATVLDLAARGWVRFVTVDGELAIVTRGSGAEGDRLAPFEQQVLNHLRSRAVDDLVSAGTLAISQGRLDRAWWRRFRRSVADVGSTSGWCVRRYRPIDVAPTAAAAVLGLVVAWTSARGGEEVALADSWVARLVWSSAIGGHLALAWRSAERASGSAQVPTEAGGERAAAWLAYRARLAARIPGSASVLATSAQLEALSHACVMGVATQVLDQVPVVAEDHRTAWSEAGGTAHRVSVAYPARPGYGQHPIKVGVAGLAIGLGTRWVQGFLVRVGDEEALTSVLDRFPGRVDLFTSLADVLAAACWIPILWAGWAVLAGAIDTVATRERSGVIVRARRPAEVLPPAVVSVLRPFSERDRFSTYLAVDDGRRPRIVAWLADERSAAPQGTQARVRATPLLGYVRSSEPIGTSTRT